jgi:hypothetical protein
VRTGLIVAVALILSFGNHSSAHTQNGSTPELRISGAVTTPLTLTPIDLKGMPRQTLKAINPHDKKEETYEGVAVRELLHRAGVPQDEKLRGAAMAIYVLAEASDDYKVVFTLAELDSSIQDSEVIVADTLNGFALG